MAIVAGNPTIGKWGVTVERSSASDELWDRCFVKPPEPGKPAHVNTGVHLFAFRLVGGSKHLPDASDPKPSGFAFHSEKNATDERDIFAAVGR